MARRRPLLRPQRIPHHPPARPRAPAQWPRQPAPLLGPAVPAAHARLLALRRRRHLLPRPRRGRMGWRSALDPSALRRIPLGLLCQLRAARPVGSVPGNLRPPLVALGGRTVLLHLAGAVRAGPADAAAMGARLDIAGSGG